MTATTFHEDHPSLLGLLVAGAAVVISVYAIATDDVARPTTPAVEPEAQTQPAPAAEAEPAASVEPSDDTGCLSRAVVVRC
jgi:hypothetical protein